MGKQTAKSTNRSSLQLGRPSFFLDRDETLDVEMYRRLGRAARNTSLKNFRLCSHGWRLGEPINPVCIGAFLEELKYNTSIEDMAFELFRIDEAPSFLTHFLLNNRNLTELTFLCPNHLTYDSPDNPVTVTPAQALAISSIANNLHLQKLDVSRCSFENNGSLEQIAKACTNVEQLFWTCTTAGQVTALANLLRDPSSILQSAVIQLRGLRDLDNRLYAREIAAAHVDNTKLNYMEIYSYKDFGEVGCFERVLCNASTIESIYNSNHTLKKIHIPCEAGLRRWSSLTRACLKLNKTQDKQKVVRNKILKYYFVGDFDVAPFVRLSLSVMPKVLSDIRGTHKQSALYRLLKNIPEFCNVSNRSKY